MSSRRESPRKLAPMYQKPRSQAPSTMASESHAIRNRDLRVPVKERPKAERTECTSSAGATRIRSASSVGRVIRSARRRAGTRRKPEISQSRTSTKTAESAIFVVNVSWARVTADSCGSENFFLDLAGLKSGL